MALQPFSPDGRAAALAELAARPLDLLIIGGGITGCGLAREAGLAGLRVGLVERVDFGAGTSSRSSKLVHGGLRYLANAEIGMVRESAHERAILRRIAPHLVEPLAFVFPFFPEDAAWKYRLALRLYDRLARVTGDDRHRHLSAAEIRERAPLLRPGVLGGMVYGECLTDDARLTLANAMAAAEQGALVANHAPVTGLLREHGRVTGATVVDGLTGIERKVAARAVVNATGPWVEATLELGTHAAGVGRIRPSKGVHIIFPAGRLPLTGAMVLHSPVGREGFAIRRGNVVYIGTTDDPHHGSLDDVRADAGAVAELLQLARDCFPAAGLGPGDISGVWAGLRPLVADDCKDSRHTSRRDEIWRSGDGLISVAGGKLTTYRRMAGRVLEMVQKDLGLPPLPAPGSDTLPLPGEVGAEAGAPGWVRHAVEAEMALTLADVLDRRSGHLLFCPDHGLGLAEAVADEMADLLGWTEMQRARQLDDYRALAAAHGATGVFSCG